MLRRRHANDGDLIVLTNCDVSDNTADLFGGAIFSQGGTLNLLRTTVKRNSATGGGIYNDGGGFGPYGPVTIEGNSGVGINTPDQCAPPGSVAGCGS